MFQWTDEIMAFRADADGYGHFDAAIAARVAAYLPPGGRVCDAGCGMGFLSMELCRRGFSVTAVDESAAALSFLRRRQAQEGLADMTILQGDLFSMTPDRPYDAMVFCLFGGVEQSLAAIRRQCRGRAVLVKKDWSHHRFDPQHRPMRRHSSFQHACDRLQALSVPYDSCRFTLEMGQPLRSVDEARRFLAAYAPDGALPDRQQAQALLQPTGRTDFPYYLPAQRSLGFIVLDAGNIPNAIEDQQ